MILAFTKTALLALSPMLAAPQVDSTVQVSLPMEARVRSIELTLGEIATVTGADPASVTLVNEVVLGSAPAPGYSRVLRADRILETLRRKAPDVTVTMIGQSACRVFPEVARITGDEIVELARQKLEEQFVGSDIEFEPLGAVQPVAIPAGFRAHTVRVRTGELPRVSGKVSVPVDVMVDGARYRTVWTSWAMKRWVTRAVLAQHVRAGQLIEPSFFERRRVQTAGNEGDEIPPELLSGAVALRDLAPGDSITALDVRRPTVVTSGEIVYLRVKSGVVQAQVPAVALDSGSVGDRIRLRTVETRQELIGTVIRRDICEIDISQ